MILADKRSAHRTRHGPRNARDVSNLSDAEAKAAIAELIEAFGGGKSELELA